MPRDAEGVTRIDAAPDRAKGGGATAFWRRSIRDRILDGDDHDGGPSCRTVR
jgi:hypothetical protein